ncbi:MAG: hypothetical protein PVG39_19225 [Desulfobacteraceae bacterium]|jgi:hypothetical protein
MKRILLNLLLLMPLPILFPCSNIQADNQITEQQALDVLVEQIKKEKLYDNQ